MCGFLENFMMRAIDLGKLVNQIFQPPGSRGFHMFRVMEILAHNFEICTIDYFLSNTIIRLLLDY